MKRSSMVFVTVFAVLSLSLLPVLPAACEGHGPKGAGCGAHGAKGLCAIAQDAEMKVVNTVSGVTLTLSSDKPEVVKSLQEHAAMCASRHADGAMGIPMEGATVKATPTKDGVEMAFTSDKPEVVTALQKHMAQCATRHESGAAGQGCRSMKGHGTMGAGCSLKGATVKVANLSDGATITLTSSDPEVVKAIQAHAAQCATRHEEGAAKGK
jgi:hypothetical protein